jgi:galactofuranosylgalactofuranosylrhamnosyl-N-acetylglucosaminyl-diphospho-decaprenol beta-1,5/1,6-galactofuranosyltransferase
MTFNILQNIVIPNLEFGAPDEMYARFENDKVRTSFEERKLIFKDGGRVSFDTFFNSMTIGIWKKHTKLNDLYLILKGNGQFAIRLGLHRIGHAHKLLQAQTIVLKEGEQIAIQFENWAKIESGMLYFSIEAIGSADFNGGYFATTTEPKNVVKLGVVITHFNRKSYVLPAIERIKAELLEDPKYKEKIELVVVDNSQNITHEESQGITLIPNKNLGGAGGFTRGLLYLKDSGDFTHCLFMDDDASCEIESICRTYSLLSYEQTDRFAIAGSLLREIEPYRLFEKGACFDGVCRPLKSGLDMRHIGDLLFAELADKKPNYGGWWFFSFALMDVNEYAFPFFVRGDDSRFSIANNFELCTMNGIGCWGDDFALKAGPLTSYLDARYHILHAIALFDKSRFSTLKIALKLVIIQLFSYNYSSAKACRLAMQHVMMGPEFFINNLDTNVIRKEIATFSENEKLQPIDRENYNVVYASFNNSIISTFIRWISLNGFLLPNFMLRKGIVFQHKGFRGILREIYRYRQVFYEYEPLGIGYVAEYDRKKFFGELCIFSISAIKFLYNFNKLKNDYKNEIPKMTNEQFWRDAYSSN